MLIGQARGQGIRGAGELVGGEPFLLVGDSLFGCGGGRKLLVLLLLLRNESLDLFEPCMSVQRPSYIYCKVF